MRPETRLRQFEIIRRFGVVPVLSDADVRLQIERRVGFLLERLDQSRRAGYVLAISGGVDSAIAGKLAQMAVEARAAAGGGAPLFIAVRLPYGEQRDEADAQAVLSAIAPTRVVTINIKPAVDAAAAEYERATGAPLSDYLKGNIKARFRMAAQYDLAAANDCLVIGTDHAAEAIMGFYTKFGDGACDVAPLSSSCKEQNRQMARMLGLPETVITKVPTADLEDLRPQLGDEDALGITYASIDAFLLGADVPQDVADAIIAQYERTAHKRDAIYGI
jgi:NAD+ synthase